MQIVLAIGFFDGVHIGHRRLLDAMVARAGMVGAKAAVYTFKNHPQGFLCGAAPRLLMATKERLAALGAHPGVEAVTADDFDARLAAMAPERFLRMLHRRLGRIETVFCGGNWRFGAGAKGTPDTLRALGVNVTEVPFASVDGEAVSSTRIRVALSAHDLSLAERMLGAPYRVRGRWFRGKGLGAQIGFPTLNLRPTVIGPLPYGVYAVDTEMGPAVANYGFAPTAGEYAWREPVWELHLLSGSRFTMYKVKSDFSIVPREYLRAERKFDSLVELKAAIAADIESLR